MGINPVLLRPRTAEVGRVKVGSKGGKPRKAGASGREYYAPQKFENENGPYFVITKTVRDVNGAENFVVDHALMQKLQPHADKIDGKLRQIPIMVNSDIIDEVAPTRFNKYNGSNLFCFGTGRGKDDATRIIDGKRTKVDCPCDFLEARGEARCKPNMLFRMTILAGDETRIGVNHAFRTTGWNSIRGIFGGLKETLERICTLSEIKLWLCVKWEHKKDRDGKTQRIIVVYVECRIRNLDELVAMQKHALERRSLRLAVMQAGNPVRLGLSAPGDESKQEQEEIAAEWYPRAEVQQIGDLDAVEGDEDDEDSIYDPETGEVYDPQAAQPQSAKTTVPASDLGRNSAGYKSASTSASKTPTESAVPAAKDDAAQGALKLDAMPKDDPFAKIVGEKLRQLAVARGFGDSDKSTLQLGMKEILSEATTEALGSPKHFPLLSREDAVKVNQYLDTAIERQRVRNDDDAANGDDDRANDNIPFDEEL